MDRTQRLKRGEWWRCNAKLWRTLPGLLSQPPLPPVGCAPAACRLPCIDSLARATACARSPILGRSCLACSWKYARF